MEQFSSTLFLTPVSVGETNPVLVFCILAAKGFNLTFSRIKIKLRKRLFTGTVPVNKKYLTGTLFIHYTDEFDPRFAFLGKKK